MTERIPTLICHELGIVAPRTEFVYLQAWPDEQTMQLAWKEFRADEEWKRVKQATNAKIW